MKKTFVILQGALPLTRQAERDRVALHRLSPVELELATLVAAIKRIPTDIRFGRLGH